MNEECSIINLPEIQELVLHHLDAEARQEAVFVCRAFYETICRLKQNKILKLDDKIKDDNVFRSMMHSSRRFREIEVDLLYRDGEVAAKRATAIVEKYKMNMKRLVVQNFPSCSQKLLLSFLEAATDVEELLLPEFKVKIVRHGFIHSFISSCSPFSSGEQKDDGFVLQKEFSKLKQLSFRCVHEMTGILDQIPDNSLEKLSLSLPLFTSPTLSEESLHAFVNRQTKIKKFVLWHCQCPNLDHLALEMLTLRWKDGNDLGKDDNKLAALLENQPALRYLHCNRIGTVSFNELRKMRNLEVLCAEVSEEVTGELSSLKEFKLHGCGSILRQVVFPKLMKLTVANSLETEHIVALSRNARNLQHAAIKILEITDLPLIIEHFPALKTLHLSSHLSGEVFFCPAPSRQNQSLEELIIQNHNAYYNTINEPVYDTINACPNVKRIKLDGVNLTEQQVLGLIQSHPSLTHFWFDPRFQTLFRGCTHSGKVDFLDPMMTEVIDIFRHSPDFIHLSLLGVEDWGDQRVEDLFVDADQIIVTKISDSMYGTCDLALVKKLVARDPYENFHDIEPGY